MEYGISFHTLAQVIKSLCEEIRVNLVEVFGILKVATFHNGLLVGSEYWGMIRQDRSIIICNENVNNDK